MPLRPCSRFLTALAVLLAAATASAQSPDYLIWYQDNGQSIPLGSTYEMEFLLQTQLPDVAGWNLYACHDSDGLELIGATSDITGADFDLVTVDPIGALGNDPFVAHEVLLDFTATTTLPIGSGSGGLITLLSIEYLTIEPGVHAMNPCTPVGADNEVVLFGGLLITPTIFPNNVFVPDDSDSFVLRAEDTTQVAGTADVVITIDANGPFSLAGWSYGICHDTNAITPTIATTGATTATLLGGGPPAFEQINVWPDPTAIPPAFSPGVGHAVLIDPLGIAVLAPGQGYEILNISYAVTPTALPTTVEFCDTVQGGAFPIDIIFTVPGGFTEVPVQVAGTIYADTIFRRGDCNNDTLSDVSDVIRSLEILFTFAAPPSCAKACDTNDDGSFDVSDVVFQLFALFVPGSDPIPAPSPACGSDPTADGLTCGAPICP